MSVTRSSDLTTLAFYDAHAQEYCESTLRMDLHGLYEPFLKELNRGAHILDAGCGSGRDTKAFLKRGFRVTAIDASPQLARLATAFTGQRCRVLCFQEMKFREQFDGVWASASLLHVPRREMHEVMPRFIQALKPGGDFYISLKEGEGECIAEGGRFFSYYTADSFRELLACFPALHETSFWKTSQIRSRQHSGPWLNFLLRKVGR
jgi:SAM-dependent methyltransferase